MTDLTRRGTPAGATGVILAGGRALRMGGGDKGLLPLGEKPILAHVIARLSGQVDRLVLNANGDPGLFVTFGLPVVPDTVGGFAGPLAGILAGLLWAKRNADTPWIVTVPWDTPFLPMDLVASLWTGLTGPDGVAIAASRGRTHPVVGLWPVTLAKRLALWLRSADHRAVRDFLTTESVAIVDFADDASFDPFFNINTGEDFARAERHWRKKENG